jgi:NAD-dependent deacetylase
LSRRIKISAQGEVEGDLDGVARRILDARSPAALTGAGISVESGIPDFRSPGGLWSVFEPGEYATLSCFLRDPEKAWKLYRAMGETLEGKQPNAGHRALAELEAEGHLTGVVTQNVDGLHQAAGSRTVLEIHGEHTQLHCVGCGRLDPLEPVHLKAGPVPRCPDCDHPLKPNVVLFEEPVRKMGEIYRLLASSDLLLVIGTSAQVVPASMFPAEVRARGGGLIEFNVEPTTLSESLLGPDDALVQGLASVTLPRVVQRAIELRGSGESR